MNIKLMSKKLTMVASAACLMAGISVAQASPVTVVMTDGTTTVTCADGAACDTLAASGVVSTSASIGGLLVSATTGISYPALGTPGAARLHMDNISIGGAGSVTVAAFDTDYTGPLSAGVFNGGFQAGGVAGGTIDIAYYLDPTNAGSVGGIGSVLLGTQSFGPGAFSGHGGLDVAGLSSPFSLAIAATITHSGNTATSFNAEIPEPSVLALAGLGMAGFGLIGVGRRRASNAIAA